MDWNFNEALVFSASNYFLLTILPYKCSYAVVYVFEKWRLDKGSQNQRVQTLTKGLSSKKHFPVSSMLRFVRYNSA